MRETPADLDHLLEICCRVELTMAPLYRFLSVRHRGTPEIVAIWLKTANEEEDHVRQFEFALKLPNPIAHTKVDVSAAYQLLKDVLELDARIR